MFDLQANVGPKSHEKQIEKLKMKFDRLEKLFVEFLAEYGLTMDQFVEFCSNPDHFEKEAWEYIVQTEKQLNQQLLLDLKNIQNPSGTKQKYRDLNLARQWMQVK